jgi:uncharacterized repeat protein (TIGR01451 family)
MRARRPGLERLEGRALLAANVTTAVLHGALLITGDGAGDDIEIDQHGPGHYLITGQNGTTVDNKPSEVVAAQTDLGIDLGGGPDAVTLNGVTVARDAQIANCHTVVLSGTGTIGRDLTITTGDGTMANDVSIGFDGGTTTIGRDLTVTTGDGTGGSEGNFVQIDSTTVGRDLTVTTGDGGSTGNTVLIVNTTVGRHRTVVTSAFLGITMTGAPSPVTAGTNLSYSITLTNNRPSDAQNVQLTDSIPANTTFVSESQTSGPTFTFSNPAVGGTGTISGTTSTLAAGASATFTVVVQVNPSTASGTNITNTATVSSPTDSTSPHSATVTTPVAT